MGFFCQGCLRISVGVVMGFLSGYDGVSVVVVSGFSSGLSGVSSGCCQVTFLVQVSRNHKVFVRNTNV